MIKVFWCPYRLTLQFNNAKLVGDGSEEVNMTVALSDADK